MDPQPTQPQSPQVPRYPLLFAVLAILFLASTLFLGYQNWQLRQQIDGLQNKLNLIVDEQSKTQPPIPENPTPPPANGMENWRTYLTQDHDVRISFQVPPTWQKTYGNFVEQSIAGQKGLQYCLTITKKSIMDRLFPPVFAGGGPCDIKWFGFGGLSIDYEAGRGGGFSDTNGFSVTTKKYYYLQNLQRQIDITSHVIESYTNPYDIQFLIIQGKNVTGSEYQGPIVGTPGEGFVAALVNLPTGRIAGLAIEMNTQIGDLSLFKQILSTFKFIK